jgi:hypothetical protein
MNSKGKERTSISQRIIPCLMQIKMTECLICSLISRVSPSMAGLSGALGEPITYLKPSAQALRRNPKYVSLRALLNGQVDSAGSL